jgi:hypothetical protein
MTTAVAALVMLAGRLLPTGRREWIEALVAESRAVPNGYRRLTWLLGCLPVLAKEVLRMRPTRSPWLPRIGMVAAVLAVAVLTVANMIRYPAITAGVGTVIYSTLLVVMLAVDLGLTVLLTRTGSPAVRYGMLAGLVTAALWTAGTPAGNRLHLSAPWLDALYNAGLVLVFTAPLCLAGWLVARRTGALEQGVLTGIMTGVYAAVANLIGGLVLVIALPERVPFDSDVLRHHHTPADILAGNVGEDLVVFIGLLLIWPMLGALLGTLGGALGSMPRTRVATAG